MDPRLQFLAPPARPTRLQGRTSPTMARHLPSPSAAASTAYLSLSKVGTAGNWPSRQCRRLCFRTANSQPATGVSLRFQNRRPADRHTLKRRSPRGGNPGAYRSTTIAMPAGPSRLNVFDTFTSAVYDPASQGPLYIVEFTQDCLVLPGTLGAGPTLLLEQNGRRYVAGPPTPCEFGKWSSMALVPAYLGASDFFMVDGPACAVGEACPDFSAGGKPIRFGFTNRQPGSWPGMPVVRAASASTTGRSRRGGVSRPSRRCRLPRCRTQGRVRLARTSRS